VEHRFISCEAYATGRIPNDNGARTYGEKICHNATAVETAEGTVAAALVVNDHGPTTQYNPPFTAMVAPRVTYVLTGDATAFLKKRKLVENFSPSVTTVASA